MKKLSPEEEAQTVFRQAENFADANKKTHSRILQFLTTVQSTVTRLMKERDDALHRASTSEESLERHKTRLSELESSYKDRVSEQDEQIVSLKAERDALVKEKEGLEQELENEERASGQWAKAFRELSTLMQGFLTDQDDSYATVEKGIADVESIMNGVGPEHGQSTAQQPDESDSFDHVEFNQSQRAMAFED